jgi:acetylornithine/N-succinyldiaminopimelate aminotransferase
MNTYGDRYGLALVRGEGALLYDAEGREYLDFLAGLAVTSLGHSHPAVARAVAEQARQLVHVSNLFFTEPQVRLAKVLAENSFADRVFFCNSGAEANEASLKLARKYSFDKYGPGRYRVLTLEQSFHGRTMATLAATGQEKIHKGFSPLMDGFSYLPWGDLAALEAALTDEVCAVMMEPIQGEGGIHVPHRGYLEKVAELCRARNVLLIFDEVQVGMGRTGTLFAYSQFGIEPDIMSLAKALANGLPIGACLAREEVAQAFSPGSHATTFGGTPLVCAAALAVLETMLAPGFLEQVVRVGKYFKGRLEELAGRHEFVREVRGLGLILGLDLTFPGDGVRKEMAARGFLMNCTSETVLRFLPPLIITEKEVDRLVPVLEEVITAQAAEVED